MPLGSDQWLRLTPEVTWGTNNASAAANTILWPRLRSGDAFAIEAQPQTTEIRGADGYNLPQQNVSARRQCQGSLKTPCYPSQAAALIAWAIPSARVLPSYTADYWDGVEARRWLGVRVRQLEMTSSSQADFAELNLSIEAWKPDPVAPTLPEPAPTVFPAEQPYLHTESKGLVTFDGTAITNFNSLTVTIANRIAAGWDEDMYVAGLDYAGRDVTFQVVRRIPSNAERVRYEAQATAAGVFQWSRGGGTPHGVKFDFQTASFITRRTVSRDFDAAQYQTLPFKAFKDGTTGLDMAATLS
jgi:hypothetical protein